jgi:hypothetical protein
MALLRSAWWRDLQRTFVLYLVLAVGLIPLGVVEGVLLLRGVTNLVVHGIVLGIGFGVAFTLWVRLSAHPRDASPKIVRPIPATGIVITYNVAGCVFKDTPISGHVTIGNRHHRRPVTMNIQVIDGLTLARQSTAHLSAHEITPSWSTQILDSVR